MHVAGSGPFAGGLAIVREVMREDGIRGFYRGCGTNLVRTTPAAAITFTSFELITRQIHAVRAELDAQRAADRAARGEEAGGEARAAATPS